MPCRTQNGKQICTRTDWWREAMGIDWYSGSGGSQPPGDQLTIWAFSDAHVPANAGKLQEAIEDSDSLFEWDFAVNLGDTFSAHGDSDASGVLITDEINNFSASDHTPSDIYSILGNHDETTITNGENLYFQKYLDPLGQNIATSLINNANRPYQVIGKYSSYCIPIGNMIIIMLGDRNDGPPPMGQDGVTGATPEEWRRIAGGLTRNEWEWFKAIVQANTNKVIIVCSHHAIFESTIGSGQYEFWDSISETDFDHSVFDDPEEESWGGCIAYIENELAVTEIATFLTTYGQYIDLWMHGHTHRKIGQPDHLGRGRFETKHGIKVLNISVINTQHHIAYLNLLESKSNIVSIDSDQLTVDTFIHSDPNAVLSKGIYATEHLDLSLKTIFRLSGSVNIILLPPGSLAALAVSSTQINLSWGFVKGADAYQLERAEVSDFSDAEIIYSGTNLSFNDEGLTNNTTYFYRIKSTSTSYTDSLYSTLQITLIVYQSESLALFTRFEDIGSPADNDDKAIIDEFIAGVKADENWVEHDVLYLLAAHAQNASRRNIKANEFNGDLVGNPPFTVDVGWAGTGSVDDWLRTNYVPSTQASKLVLNNECYWFWVLNNIAAAVSISMGANDGTRLTSVSLKRSDHSNKARFACSSAGAVNSTDAITDTTGLWAMKRLNNTQIEFWRHNTLIETLSLNSNGLLSLQIKLLGAGITNENTIVQASTAQIAAFGCGSGAITIPDMHTRLTNYLTSKGAI